MNIPIKNEFINAEFDIETGAWRSLCYANEAESVIQMGGFPFNIIIDGKPFFMRRKTIDVRQIADGSGVEFVFQQEGIEVIHSITLEIDRPVMRQSVEIQCNDGRGPRLLSEINYYVPGFAIGHQDDCLFHSPGQRRSMDIPYNELSSNVELRLSPAPCHTSGLMALENPGLQKIASTWLYSEAAVDFPVVRGDGNFIHLEHGHQLSLWLRPGDSVVSEGFAIMMTEGSLDDHLANFREAAYGRHQFSAKDVPQWFRDARIFQIAPYPLSDWTPHLGEIRDMGFNLLYLCPVQAGSWYVVYDHFAINAEVGTETELREFIEKAHDLEMKVIFDFIPQGVGDSSPFIQEHPDWLVRDMIGRTFGSHGWGPRPGAPNNGHTLSMDWGNPEYRKFAVDWAMWYVKTFDIDGFRCDALHWKEPNLDLENPRPAWHTTYGGIKILEDLRKKLKAYKPEAILLSEVWGPIFQRSTDGSYENGWIMHELNRSWLSNESEPLMTGAEYVEYLKYTEAARPKNYIRVNFTANHDMTQNARLACEHPLGNAVSFVHAFARGIPFVMWLEPNGRRRFFTELMANRAKLSGYECSYNGAMSDAEDLFMALWSKGESSILAVSNVSMNSINAEIRLWNSCQNPKISFSSENVTVETSDNGIKLDIPAAGYALIRLE